MGVYGSVIMVQYSKRISSIKSVTSNKVYKTFSRYSYELYLFSDPFNYVLVYLIYCGLGNYPTSDVDSILAFLIRFFGSIILAMLVIYVKNKIQSSKVFPIRGN